MLLRLKPHRCDSECMSSKPLVLSGSYVRLEALEHRHVAGLVAAAAGDPSLYRWSPVPQGRQAAEKYIDTALAWQAAGSAVPFAIVRLADDCVIGSTRFWNIECWAWPEGHPSHGRATADACEIGYTWYSPSAIRTAANTESKFLMLGHAFESWKVLRVCFHTDVRNERSRAALARIGAKPEGILRAHRMAADFIPRDSARFSITASEWPTVKQGLVELLAR
jgi:RimJ/RimL family protein N-acetyltransferase